MKFRDSAYGVIPFCFIREDFVYEDLVDYRYAHRS